MLLGRLSTTTYAERQRERLLRECGPHIDFYWDCAARFSGASTPDVLGWVNGEIASRVRAGADQSLAALLRKIALSFVFEKADNSLLAQLIKWNDLRSFNGDTVYAAVDLADSVDCFVDLDSRSSWVITTTFGYRDLLSDFLVLFWDVLCCRCTIAPSRHLKENVALARAGRQISRYSAASLDHVHQTEALAIFAKLFIFAHEVAHVDAYKSNLTFGTQIEEERYADNLGAELYLAAALMMVPPLPRLMRTHGISNSSQRREFMLRDPAVRLAVTSVLQSGTPVDAKLVDALRGSCTFGSDAERDAASTLLSLVWVAPVLVFRLIDLLERASERQDPQTHPPAVERIQAYWGKCPNEWVERRVEQDFGKSIASIFAN